MSASRPESAVKQLRLFLRDILAAVTPCVAMSRDILIRHREFDPHGLNAVVTFMIDRRFDEIPDDSDASILTSGLLGSQYIGLQPGGSEFYLEGGSEIQFTQSAIVIENLISKYLFNQDSDSESE